MQKHLKQKRTNEKEMDLPPQSEFYSLLTFQ